MKNSPGDVAQLGEHRLCKAGVRGSSPLVSTEPIDSVQCPQKPVAHLRLAFFAPELPLKRKQYQHEAQASGFAVWNHRLRFVLVFRVPTLWTVANRFPEFDLLGRQIVFRFRPFGATTFVDTRLQLLQ